MPDEPLTISEAVTEWIEHDQSHEPGDPPCDRCLELDDAMLTALREVGSG